MLQTIIIEACYQFVHIIAFLMCHYNTCYYPDNRLRHYVTIKNSVLADILICQGTTKYGDVAWEDRDKLSVLGLITYLLAVPCIIVMIVTSVGQLFVKDMATIYKDCYYFITFVIIISTALNSYSLAGNKK